MFGAQNFSGKIEEIREKFLRIPKNLPAPTLMATAQTVCRRQGYKLTPKSFDLSKIPEYSGTNVSTPLFYLFDE